MSDKNNTCQCYARKCIYSKRHKKRITKQISLLNHNKDEANILLNEFATYIRRDNDLYTKEKKMMLETDYVETKPTNLLNTNEHIDKNLDKIEIKDVFDKFDSDLSSNICIFAGSKSGKTYMAKQLVEEWKKKDKSLIILWMVGNKNADIYKDIIDDPNYIFFDGVKVSLIETIKIINSNIDEMYNFLFVFDDIINVRYMDTLRNLAMSWRNSRLNSIFICQNTTLILPQARNNSTVYFFGLNKQKESEKVMEDFLESNPFFDDLKNMKSRIRLYQSCTEDHKFIVNFPLENDREKLYSLKAKTINAK